MGSLPNKSDASSYRAASRTSHALSTAEERHHLVIDSFSRALHLPCDLSTCHKGMIQSTHVSFVTSNGSELPLKIRNSTRHVTLIHYWRLNNYWHKRKNSALRKISYVTSCLPSHSILLHCSTSRRHVRSTVNGTDSSRSRSILTKDMSRMETPLARVPPPTRPPTKISFKLRSTLASRVNKRTFSSQVPVVCRPRVK